MRWWSWRWNVCLSEVQTTKISSASMVTEAFWSANKSAREGKKCKISATDDVTNDSCRKFWNRRCKLILTCSGISVFGAPQCFRISVWSILPPKQLNSKRARKGKTATPLFSRRTNFGTNYRNKKNKAGNKTDTETESESEKESESESVFFRSATNVCIKVRRACVTTTDSSLTPTSTLTIKLFLFQWLPWGW